MQYSEIMIRYGELSTKGKNRMRFINKLRNNISDVLSIYPQVKVTADWALSLSTPMAIKVPAGFPALDEQAEVVEMKIS